MTMNKANLITSEEARSALYVDFEGQKDRPPVLLGATRRAQVDRVWQYITDPRLAPLGDAEGLEVLDLQGSVERIIQRAEKKDRRIVAWSVSRLDVVREYCPITCSTASKRRYVNARSLAVYWRNKCHGGQKPPSNMLRRYLVLIDYEVPDDVALGGPASRSGSC